eukprot:RCo047846
MAEDVRAGGYTGGTGTVAHAQLSALSVELAEVEARVPQLTPSHKGEVASTHGLVDRMLRERIDAVDVVGAEGFAGIGVEEDRTARRLLVKRAQRVLDRLQKLLPSGAALEWNRRGEECFASGDCTGAVEAYSRALREDPSQPLVLHNRGSAWLRAGNSRAALADMDKATELCPSWFQPHLGRASVLLGSGDFGGAEEALRLATELSGNGTGSEEFAPVVGAMAEQIRVARNNCSQAEEILLSLREAVLRLDAPVQSYNLGLTHDGTRWVVQFQPKAPKATATKIPPEPSAPEEAPLVLQPFGLEAVDVQVVVTAGRFEVLPTDGAFSRYPLSEVDRWGVLSPMFSLVPSSYPASPSKAGGSGSLGLS